MRLCKYGKSALLLKLNGVKNNEMFLFSQKCWAWHIFCCRKAWRHNVSVCHLAGECNTTSLACLSCVTKMLFLFSLRESLHRFCRLNRDIDRAAGKMGTNIKKIILSAPSLYLYWRAAMTQWRERSPPTNVAHSGSIPGQCHMWVEFVVGPCLRPRVFLRVLRFSSLLHPSSNSNSTRIEDPHENHPRLMCRPL